MKLLAISHSLINITQQMLFEKIGQLNLAEVLCLAPNTWWDEKCVDVVKHNFELRSLESVGKTFYNFRLRGLEQHIQEYNPNLLYIMEEPHTNIAFECKRIAESMGIPYACFSWENVPDRRFGTSPNMEEEVIKGADVLVAGNEGAKRRFIALGSDEDKISICPQTGINTSLFHSIKGMRKVYDASYFGRMVEEKGCRFIENAVKELKLKMLWIGGRGSFKPSYGNYPIRWVDYLKTPEYYNQIKLFVHFPYSYQGYSEQFAYTLAEAMACGIPVVTSDNGSISEVYGDSPAIITKEGDEKMLKSLVSFTLTHLDAYNSKEGVKWVKNNLSLEVIGKKLIKILEKVI